MCFDCRKDQTDLNAVKKHCSEIAAKVNTMSKALDEIDSKLIGTVRAKIDDFQSSLLSRMKEIIVNEVAHIQLQKSTLGIGSSYADVTRSTLNVSTSIS